LSGGDNMKNSERRGITDRVGWEILQWHEKYHEPPPRLTALSKKGGELGATAATL